MKEHPIITSALKNLEGMRLIGEGNGEGSTLLHVAVDKILPEEVKFKQKET